MITIAHVEGMLYVSTDMTSYCCHIVATDLSFWKVCCKDEVSDFLQSWWAWCNISDIYNQRASPFMVTPETFSPPTHSVKLKYAHWATVRCFDFMRFSFIMIFIFIACLKLIHYLQEELRGPAEFNEISASWLLLLLLLGSFFHCLFALFQGFTTGLLLYSSFPSGAEQEIKGRICTQSTD